jgi:hypothetical protein
MGDARIFVGVEGEECIVRPVLQLQNEGMTKFTQVR